MQLRNLSHARTQIVHIYITEWTPPPLVSHLSYLFIRNIFGTRVFLGPPLDGTAHEFKHHS